MFVSLLISKGAFRYGALYAFRYITIIKMFSYLLAVKLYSLRS